MATEDPGLSEALDRVQLALAEMASGNPEPYLACWADSDDVTLFGAWGPIDKGLRRLAKTLRWVGTRFRGGRLVPEHSVVASSGDLAYTVGFERGEVTVDDGPPRLMTIGSRTSTGASAARGGSCTGTPTSRLSTSAARRGDGIPAAAGLTRRRGIQYLLTLIHHS
jgi:hypothetical protein